MPARTQDNQASPSDTELAADLRGVLHRIVKMLRRQASNDEMLSLTERSTLGLLYQHVQLLPSELAALEKVTSQSMSQVINQLHRLGYIHKASSGEDKRKVLLTLTASGKKYIEQTRMEKQEWLARMLHEIPAKDKQTLASAILILNRLVNE
ncbi:MAG TPA: MarR family transcriptional regulator [Puia sp.]|nr:MarR family transcriptional regulator [Puia sp.]